MPSLYNFPIIFCGNFDFLKSQHGNIYPSYRCYLINLEAFSLNHVSFGPLVSEGVRKISIINLIIYLILKQRLWVVGSVLPASKSGALYFLLC